MTAQDLAMQIRSLRAQLDVLEAKLRSMPSVSDHSLSDLRGMLAGQSDSTLEEIEQSLYRTPELDEP